MRKETAASHVIHSVPVLGADATAGDAVDLIRSRPFDYIERVYVVDGARRLKGWMKTAALFTMPGTRRLAEAMHTGPPVILPGTGQEEMATQSVRHNLAALPVVDHENRFLGVVPAQAIIGILRKEHLEDLHRLTGITQRLERAGQPANEPIVTRLRHRLPWLLAGLAGSLGATWLMAAFEDALSKHLALAYFLPGIVYLADAIGTQSETIAVRGISISRFPFRRMAAGELKTGLLIGLVMGLVYVPFAWLLFGDRALAFTVGATVFLAGGVAATVGMCFPWLLDALRVDPAFGSGPMATILQDVLSILIYFAIAGALLL
jgi:magnesium transporter